MVMLFDQGGRVIDPRVKVDVRSQVERGPLSHVNGIVVHQTGGSTAQSTLNAYAMAGANGAHFLIDRDGTIYQTASVLKRTNHVGRLRARCLAEHRCRPTEARQLLHMKPTARDHHEMGKRVPDRYPSNRDSIGIELVGQALPVDEPNPDKRTYEAVTPAQNASLAWLIRELQLALKVPVSEVFRHPDISQKNMTEAATAKW